MFPLLYVKCFITPLLYVIREGIVEATSSKCLWW